MQGAFPVDADHTHRPKVPDQQRHRRVVHRHVVRFKDLATNSKSAITIFQQEVKVANAEDSPEVHVAEPEEQHERGEDEPAVDELNTKARNQTAPP